MFGQSGSKMNILYCLYIYRYHYSSASCLSRTESRNGLKKGQKFPKSCRISFGKYLQMLVMSVAPLSSPSSNMTIQQKSLLSVFSMFQNLRLQAGKLSLSDYSSAIPHLSALHCCLLHPMVCHPPSIPHPPHRQKEAKPILVNEDLDQSSPQALAVASGNRTPS